MGKDGGGGIGGYDDMQQTKTVYRKDPELKDAVEHFLEAWDSQTEKDQPYKPKVSMGVKAAINKLRKLVE